MSIKFEDFGPTGTADDTATLQLAADYLATNGGTLECPQFAQYRISQPILFRPTANDGYPPSLSPPSNLIFWMNKRVLQLNLNGAQFFATAAMDSMFKFTSNAAVNEVAPFHSAVRDGHFIGGNLAASAIYSDWCWGLTAQKNRITDVDVGVASVGYGVMDAHENRIRARVCFDISQGGADSLFHNNDLYPGQASFLLGNAGAAVPGQLRIFSNAATNEGQGDSSFVKVDGTANPSLIRNVSILDNGIAGMSQLIYARGKSGTYNLRDWVVEGNNVLDYGSKTSVGLIDVTEIDRWHVTDNAFRMVSAVSSVTPIYVTNGARSVFANNTVSGAGPSGFQGRFIHRCAIQGNIFHDIGAPGGAVVRLTDGSDRNLVTGNIIDQDSGSFASIGFKEDAPSDYNRAFGNLVNNVATQNSAIGAHSSFTL